MLYLIYENDADQVDDTDGGRADFDKVVYAIGYVSTLKRAKEIVKKHRDYNYAVINKIGDRVPKARYEMLLAEE